MKCETQEEIGTKASHTPVWWVMTIQSSKRSNHWDGHATQRKFPVYRHCHLYRCVLSLVDPYCWMSLHKSGPGRVAAIMSYAFTLSSIISEYEVLGTLEHVALKSNNNSKSLSNLSKTTFLDNACCISPNLLWPNRQCTRHS